MASPARPVLGKGRKITIQGEEKDTVQGEKEKETIQREIEEGMFAGEREEGRSRSSIGSWRRDRC